MKRTAYIIMLIVLVSVGIKSGLVFPSDKREGISCYASYANSDTEICEASLYAVIANPDKYKELDMYLTGYLRRVHESLVLYPSKESYLYSAGKGGVLLLVGSPDDIELMRGKQEFDGPATVMGKFEVDIGLGRIKTVGAITGDVVVFGETMPGARPALPSN